MMAIIFMSQWQYVGYITFLMVVAIQKILQNFMKLLRSMVLRRAQGVDITLPQVNGDVARLCCSLQRLVR
jgi:ABC-type sugar transport system permease subunit